MFSHTCHSNNSFSGNLHNSRSRRGKTRPIISLAAASRAFFPARARSRSKIPRMSVTRRRMQQTKALTVGRRRPRLRRRLRKRRTTTTTTTARLLGRSRDAHGVSAVPEYFYDFCLGARGTDFSGAKPPCDLSVRIHPSVHPCSFSPPLSLSLSLFSSLSFSFGRA